MTTIFLGVIFGLFFGLTGSGGSTLAVPLLVYGIGLPPHSAVCVSMISVGTLAALRSVQALRHREAELGTAVLVAAAGLAGAPIGAWAGQLLSEKWLLSAFALVIVIVALRSVRQGDDTHAPALATNMPTPKAGEPPTLRSRRHYALLIIGFTAGSLAGLLGIGGGFLITPALVLFCGHEFHRAITTSMISIALISVPAMIAHWVAGQRPPIDLVALFSLGGFLGLIPGSLLAAGMSRIYLQRIFAWFLLLVAGFILIRLFGA